MDLNSLVFLVVGLVVGVLVGGYFQFKPFAPTELAKLGEMAAMAAEQYRRDGKLQTNEEQLRFAIDFMKTRLPFLQRLSTEDMVKIIKSFVPQASALTAQTKADKAVAASTSPPTTPPVPVQPVVRPPVGRMGL